MGLITSIIEKFSLKKVRVMMLGLDAVGKTTIVYKMKLKQVAQTVPTMEINCQSIKYKNLELVVFDFGFRNRVKKLWRHYFDNSDALIYVIDSSDNERIELAKQFLYQILEFDSLTNKIDVSKIKPSQIVQKLGLQKRKQVWNLQPCCALNGDGLAEGLQWLRNSLKNKKK